MNSSDSTKTKLVAVLKDGQTIELDASDPFDVFAKECMAFILKGNQMLKLAGSQNRVVSDTVFSVKPSG